MKAAEEMKREKKNVQWSGYGELGNISQKPLQPTAEGAEQLIRVRNILQDFYRRGDYELEQAAEDIMRIFTQQPTAEGAEEIAQCCPVCGGNGLVPNGFYNQTSGQWTSCSTLPGTCRTCNGTGVILPSYLHAQKIADKMVEERCAKCEKR